MTTDELAKQINYLYETRSNGEAWIISIQLIKMHMGEFKSKVYKECLKDTHQYFRILLNELDKKIDAETKKS